VSFNEDEFERFVIETGVPMVKAAEGCTHVTAGKSPWNEQPEFVVVTRRGLSTLYGPSRDRTGRKR
jgi:hypothetical protein